jgi:hypothetical protein
MLTLFHLRVQGLRRSRFSSMFFLHLILLDRVLTDYSVIHQNHCGLQQYPHFTVTCKGWSWLCHRSFVFRWCPALTGPMAFIEKMARKPAVLPLLFRDELIDFIFRRISSTRGLTWTTPKWTSTVTKCMRSSPGSIISMRYALQPLVHSGEA